MITIEPFFQLLTGLLYTHLILFAEQTDVFGETSIKFFFRNPANRCKFIIQRNVVQVIQVAENAHFAELRHSGQQREADVGVLAFQYTVEGFQLASVFILQRFVANGLQQGLVVFVHQDDDIPPALFNRPLNNALEPQRKAFLRRMRTIDGLPFTQPIIQNLLQCRRRIIFLRVQIQVQHRILRPILLQFLHGQALEQLFLALEIGFQRTQKQALAKPARAAQKNILPRLSQLIYQRSLIYIAIAALTNLLKCLYAYRI